MYYQGPGRRTIALALSVALVLGLVGIGTSNAASHHPAVTDAATGTVSLTASTGFKFSPDLIQNVASTGSVTVSFIDGDTLDHTFTISSRQGVVIPNSFTNAQLVAYFAQYPALLSLTSTPGQTVPGNFTAPGVGWYEFVCLQAGHFEEGMYGFIAFGEPLPSNLTVGAGYDGPGAAVFIIVGTIVSLTVIAIVLGFVVGRRRGAQHEMPPERLGYPEPALPSSPPSPPEPPPPPK
jgi:uncharacterized cupredoxin-like copper-binding protein